MPARSLPADAIEALRQRLQTLPPRRAERHQMIREMAATYGVSETTVYRALHAYTTPRVVHRGERGIPRVLPQDPLERSCELIAAMKLRTANKQGRHLSTAETIRLLVDYGFETPDGFVRAPQGLLKRRTVNRYLRHWGYNPQTVARQPPAVRFQASQSNDCRPFDLSPSDLKQVPAPARVREARGHPLLMLYSVVDDRSGVAYQEYPGVYGEDVEAALRILFAAMAPKAAEDVPFQGIPAMLYRDKGPIARSQVFHQVMRYLGVGVRTHLPQGHDGRRVSARATGKVERTFRTVKEMHETLYHFHTPETEAEAHAWHFQFLRCDNAMPHRTEARSRMDDGVQHLPPTGLCAMCSWERFCTFAREPERRKVGVDARITVEGVASEVDPDLAGDTVRLGWGLFDQELYVEHDDQRDGPYQPVDGPIPLQRYRRFKTTTLQQRVDRLDALAAQLALPQAAVEDPVARFPLSADRSAPTVIPLADPDPFHEFTFPTAIAAKRAVADVLAMPLAKLTPAELEALNTLLARALRKSEILAHVQTYLKPVYQG